MGILSHESTPPIPYELPGRAPRPAMEAHLRNFFDAFHGQAQLNCDARNAFQSEAAIYWLRAADESSGTLRFTPEQLAVWRQNWSVEFIPAWLLIVPETAAAGLIRARRGASIRAWRGFSSYAVIWKRCRSRQVTCCLRKGKKPACSIS